MTNRQPPAPDHSNESSDGRPVMDWFRSKLTPKNIGAGIIIASLCGAFGKDLYETAYGDSATTVAETESVIDDFEGHERVNKSDLIPEDERSGRNLLVSASPLRMIMKKSGYQTFFEETFKTMFEILPAGTTIHLVAPEDSSDLAMEVAREMFPQLNFVLYAMPPTHPGIEYAQDTFFATGGFDEKGRSVLAASTCDHSSWNALIEHFQPAETWGDALPFGDQRKKVCYAPVLMGDEMLAKRYPEKFMDKDVPVKTEGGDIHISRMPNGKIALVVGLKNLAETVFFGIKDPATGRLVTEDYAPTTTMVFEFMEEAKKMYKKTFDVDEVIIAGEEFLYLAAMEQYRRIDEAHNHYRAYRKHTRYEQMIYQEVIDGIPPHNQFFFHLDMALKTVTTPSGESVALCTEFTNKDAKKIVDAQFSEEVGEGQNLDEEYRSYLEERREKAFDALSRESMYTQLIQAQFDQLGYKVVKLPCGPAPAMNYTNSVVFMGEGSEKVAIVPQYGISEDTQAVKAYESLGFKVLAPSYKDLIDSTVEQQKGMLGRTLGEMGLKGTDIGLLGIGSYHCRTVILGEPGQPVFNDESNKPNSQQPKKQLETPKEEPKSKKSQ